MRRSAWVVRERQLTLCRSADVNVTDFREFVY
jgi:hypothetical protein